MCSSTNQQATKMNPKQAWINAIEQRRDADDVWHFTMEDGEIITYTEKEMNDYEEETKMITNVEFDTNAMDNALYKDDLDWSFDKPEGEYSVVYVFKKEKEEQFEECDRCGHYDVSWCMSSGCQEEDPVEYDTCQRCEDVVKVDYVWGEGYTIGDCDFTGRMLCRPCLDLMTKRYEIKKQNKMMKKGKFIIIEP